MARASRRRKSLIRRESLERRALEIIIMEEYVKTVGGPQAEKLMKELERAKREIYREYFERRRAKHAKRGVTRAER